MMQSDKSVGLTERSRKDLDIMKDLLDSYQEREVEIVSCRENAQKEATDIIAKAVSHGRSLIDEATTKCAKMNEAKRGWEEEKESIAKTCNFANSEIDLNIGGQCFTTTLTTLTRFPDTMIGAMFSGRHELKKNNAGAFFIDRDGRHFHYILNFLRSPETYKLKMEGNLKEELKDEADFYGLGDLMFPVAVVPFIPAQPEKTNSRQGYPVIVTQDLQGMWFMACARTQATHEVLPTIMKYCRHCTLGWIGGLRLPSTAAFNNGREILSFNDAVTIAAFNNGREILPNQPTCSVNYSCPGCRRMA